MNPSFEEHKEHAHAQPFEACEEEPCRSSRIKTIAAKLDELNDVTQAIQTTNQEIESRITVILEPVQKEIDNVKAQYAEVLKAAADYAAMLEGEIKTLVMSGHESVKGKTLHAVYVPPSLQWDKKKLEGYCVSHPEIITLAKAGKPSVSIRAVKQAEAEE